MKIDLDAATISLEQNVWRLFPGSGYRFRESFIEQGVGYLDMPGLVLPNGKVSEAKDLLQRVVAADEAYQDILARKSNDDLQNTVKIPETATSGARRTRNKNSIISFYEAAVQNDIIVMPDQIYGQLTKFYIGRFVDDRIYNAVYEGIGGIKVNARNIEWKGPFDEKIVSNSLSEGLRNQHPFTLLPKSVFIEVFSLYYSSFIFGDRHVATMYNGDDFLDADSALLGHISRLSAAACARVLGDGTPGASAVSPTALVKILLQTPPIQFTSSQQADIHSPGFTRWTSGTIVCLTTAAVFTALVYLGQTAQNKNSLQMEIQNLEVLNLAPGADPLTTHKISESTKLVLEGYGIDTTWELCKACAASHERAATRSSAKKR